MWYKPVWPALMSGMVELGTWRCPALSLTIHFMIPFEFSQEIKWGTSPVPSLLQMGCWGPQSTCGHTVAWLLDGCSWFCWGHWCSPETLLCISPCQSITLCQNKIGNQSFLSYTLFRKQQDSIMTRNKK